MSRSTQEWEALLDGTMPGPWEYQETPYCPDRQREDECDAHGLSTEHITYECGCEEDDTCQVQREVIGNPDGIISSNPQYFDDPKPADMKLIAAAPDAVAEVIRLQNALQGLADWHDIKAMKARTYPAPGHEPEGERAARVHETARDKITAILDGEQSND